MEIYDTPSFLEVSAYSHLMQTPRRFLSASVDSQLTSAPNNLYACQLKKKMHNLEVENYVLFGGPGKSHGQRSQRVGHSRVTKKQQALD